ncbi:hypothetical protein CDEST_14403 [Colletotrichum destructivum]|uniref:MADS-box domain-containing protein n=1 Tax=Colletotrichum destructivum TaxID=34406 RepID=A0AAX4J1R8_9PEZI|nr:hypothetical protein CDEST_14403 [Colletotrichum destructivum]
MSHKDSRCFRTRKDGLIAKAHEIQKRVPGTKVAIFAFYKGKMYSYQSDENWPVDPFKIEGVVAVPDDQKLPDHFATISVERTSRHGSGSSRSMSSDEVSVLTGGGSAPMPVYNPSKPFTPASRMATPPMSSITVDALEPSLPPVATARSAMNRTSAVASSSSPLPVTVSPSMTTSTWGPTSPWRPRTPLTRGSPRPSATASKPQGVTKASSTSRTVNKFPKYFN